MSVQTLLPPKIYCPKCGKETMVKRVTYPLELERIGKRGFSEGGRFNCECGVVGVVLIKPLPNRPTYTLLFDIYKQKV